MKVHLAVNSNINSPTLFQYAMSFAESRSPFVIIQVCPSRSSLWPARENTASVGTSGLSLFTHVRDVTAGPAVCIKGKRKRFMRQHSCVFIWWITTDTVSFCGFSWEPYFHDHTLIVSIFIMIKEHLFVWCPIYPDDHSLDLLLLKLWVFNDISLMIFFLCVSPEKMFMTFIWF